MSSVAAHSAESPRTAKDKVIWVTCPKCGNQTEGKYKAEPPGDRTLVPQPHVIGMDRWCFPFGIPKRTFETPPTR